MAGLLYKDFCVLRRQLWSMLLLVAVFCFIPNGGRFDLGMFFVMYTALLPMSLMAFDERARWDKLVLMLPVTRREVVMGKYVAGWCLTALAGVLYVAGRSLHGTPDLNRVLLTLSVTLILQAVLYPCLFRFGVEKGRLFMGGAMGVAVFLCLQLGLVGSEVSAVEKLPVSPGVPLFILAVVLNLVSILVAEKQYAIREG